MKIGQVIRRLRHAQGKTLQQLCDATGDRIQSGYLSRIERDEMAPSVYIVADIAKALDVTIDTLIKEAAGDFSGIAAPVEQRRLVPVVAWTDSQTLTNGYNPSFSKVEHWICPPRPMCSTAFALDVTDTSMNTSDSLSFSVLGMIFVDPEKAAKHTDYVLAYSPGHKKAIFRRLITDGIEEFLAPLNSTYPMRKLADDWIITGVVAAHQIDLRST